MEVKQGISVVKMYPPQPKPSVKIGDTVKHGPVFINNFINNERSKFEDSLEKIDKKMTVEQKKTINDKNQILREKNMAVINEKVNDFSKKRGVVTAITEFSDYYVADVDGDFGRGVNTLNIVKD